MDYPSGIKYTDKKYIILFYYIPLLYVIIAITILKETCLSVGK